MQNSNVWRVYAKEKITIDDILEKTKYNFLNIFKAKIKTLE